MGRAKLLLDWGGRPVIRCAVEQVKAGGVNDVVVVVGNEGEAIRGALSGLTVRLVQNPRPEAGQASSIASGVLTLSPATEAALIVLGDQPALPAEVIPKLVVTFQETGKAIVAPLYQGVQANPVLFGAAVFPELRELTGDRGARAVVDKDRARVAFVSFNLPMPPDLDTVEEYERLRPRSDRV